ncbi:GntR family transcriptional regulator [Gordonia sp. SMJS1]|nr:MULTISPECIES: GntR family transcriptional regulator [unclassified Gordonia (in: high G+C Gram-positive bacteria)]WGJ85559.1 GntR family transcriptional regulator [Gordonia sp. SMJS1]
MQLRTTAAGRLRADNARMVADVLRRQIHDGDLAESLDERTLIADFNVSRNTIRDALAILTEERLIERAPRIGTHVVARKLDHGLDALQGLKETFRLHGEVRNTVKIATLVDAPRAVARRLQLADAQAVYIERLRYLDDEPISLDITYLVPDLGIPLLEHDLENNDVFTLLEQIAGGPLGHATMTVEAVDADPHSAAHLEIGSGTSLLLLERLTHLAHESRPVDLEYIRMRSDRVCLRSTARREAAGS